MALRVGGRLTNGSASATKALINAVHKGVVISGAVGAVTNFGTITTNAANAITIVQTLGTVTNFGTISGPASSVDLRAGGRITNGSAAATRALISSDNRGVNVTGVPAR